MEMWGQRLWRTELERRTVNRDVIPTSKPAVSSRLDLYSMEICCNSRTPGTTLRLVTLNNFICQIVAQLEETLLELFTILVEE